MSLAQGMDNTLVRLGLALTGGALVASNLFVLMSLMIGGDSIFQRPDRSSTVMHFIRVKDISQVQTRARERPPEPEKVEQPPPPMRPQIATVASPSAPEVRFDFPNIDMPLGGGTGVFVGGELAAASSNGELIPLVRIEPQYPRQAAMSGIEGWIKAYVDIEPDGSVSNIQIVDASPRRVWDRSTERALLRWKFRPVEIDGRAVRVEGHEITIEFNLGN